MNKKRILSIIIICALFIFCYFCINIKYDKLARYPFGTDREREIISNNLDNQEIDYIVEYAIEPDYFMDYVYYQKFNVFHVEQYNEFRFLFPYFDIEESIIIVERLFLLNKANDDFYYELLTHDKTYIINILRTYL